MDAARSLWCVTSVATDGLERGVGADPDADGEWRPLDDFPGEVAADGVAFSTAGRIAERPESVSRLRRLSSERNSKRVDSGGRDLFRERE